jgi:hypothetical protein
MNSVKIWGTSVGVMAALLIAAPQAIATERVADGNFESTTCDGSSCTSPGWTAAVSGQPPSPALAIGPLCAPFFAWGGPPECADGGHSGYLSPVHWARLGSSSRFVGGDDRPPTLTTSIAQSVEIPAAPATLSFNLHIVPQGFATGTFRVTVDGQLVFDTVDGATGYDSYPLLSVPVDFAAGPGPHELRFEGNADVDPGPAPDGTAVASDTFDLDNVSLDAPDPPASEPAPGSGPGPGPLASASTGQRAAGLKKCKKKHSQTARKKCRRRANRLPLEAKR